MKRRRDRSRCYLCGSDQKITKEHTPPKGIFPEPRPTDLITVPCCERCNNANSKADELLRLFVSGAVNRNQQGREIWNQKVRPNTIEQNKLKHEVRKIISTTRGVDVMTESGVVSMPYVTVEQDQIKPTLIRITKGLLWTLYPDIAYDDLKFDVQQIDQFKLAESIKGVAGVLQQHERGGGVFRFLHGPVADAERCVLWILVFFDSIAFAAFQTTKDRCLTPE